MWPFSSSKQEPLPTPIAQHIYVAGNATIIGPTTYNSPGYEQPQQASSYYCTHYPANSIYRLNCALCRHPIPAQIVYSSPATTLVNPSPALPQVQATPRVRQVKIQDPIPVVPPMKPSPRVQPVNPWAGVAWNLQYGWLGSTNPNYYSPNILAYDYLAVSPPARPVRKASKPRKRTPAMPPRKRGSRVAREPIPTSDDTDDSDDDCDSTEYSNGLLSQFLTMDWDIRQPINEAKVWGYGTGVRSMSLEKTATKQGARTIQVTFDTSRADKVLDDYSFRRFRQTARWEEPLTITKPYAQALEVRDVLDNIRNYWHERLNPGELQSLSFHPVYATPTSQLHMGLLDANFERVEQGQWLNSSDLRKTRRIDLLKGASKVTGFKVIRNRGDTVELRCILQSNR